MRYKILLLLLICLLLQGCGLERFYVERVIPEGIPVLEQDKQLTEKNKAYLFNEALQKILCYSSDGDTFTYMIPNHYKYSQLSDFEWLEPSAYLRMWSVREPYDEEGNLVNNYYQVTAFYLSNEEWIANEGNWFLNTLKKKAGSVSSYDKTIYSSYGEFMSSVEAKIGDTFNEQVRTTKYFLQGSEVEVPATEYLCTVYVDEVPIILPCKTYTFDIEERGKLVVNIEFVSADTRDVLSVQAYSENDFTIPKHLKQQLLYCQEFNFDLDNYYHYFLLGDYSKYFYVEPVDTIYERIESTDASFSESEEEENNSDIVDVVPEVSIEDNDYSTEVQGYFEN